MFMLSVQRPGTSPSEQPSCKARAPISGVSSESSASSMTNSKETLKCTVKVDELRITTWFETSSQALTAPRSRLSGSKLMAGPRPWPTNCRTYVGLSPEPFGEGDTKDRRGPSMMLSLSSAQRAMQYSGAEKTFSLVGQKFAMECVASDGPRRPMGVSNQKSERKRTGILHSYVMGISDTFLIMHSILDAMPEQVGGKVTMDCPRQKVTFGSQARPDTRSVLGWPSL
mmetsp:Transcript_107359/g.309046  ORF Transcript_107359/g.309046 Transcript_107359/m.309046 type:complete len:227 (+) Transcript_107359:2676-3356(+)